MTGLILGKFRAEELRKSLVVLGFGLSLDDGRIDGHMGWLLLVPLESGRFLAELLLLEILLHVSIYMVRVQGVEPWSLEWRSRIITSIRHTQLLEIVL